MTTTDTSAEDELASNVPKKAQTSKETEHRLTHKQTNKKNLLRVSAGRDNKTILALIMSQHPK